jgi:D-alanine-D-alanine ligase
LEVTCGVLELEAAHPKALPPTLIEPLAADWYDFKSRYGTGGSRHHCPAPFSATLLERIQEIALAAHKALGARDLSRADFVVDPASDSITLLELNTLPGMTATSLFPEAAAVSGVPFTELCSALVRAALGRQARVVPEARQMPD